MATAGAGRSYETYGFSSANCGAILPHSHEVRKCYLFSGESQIISEETWQKAQQAIERNKRLSTRHARGVYLLQNLAYCGDCGLKLRILTNVWEYPVSVDGTRKKQRRSVARYRYGCRAPGQFKEEPHPRPYSHHGIRLDWKVWRKVVDFGVKRPDLVRYQVYERQAALKAQGDTAQSEIERARKKLGEIDNERAFYQRQAARGKITEQEFDGRMNETQHQREHWKSELDRLRVLRDDAAKVEAGLDYAEKLLTTIQSGLGAIDIPPDELSNLPRDHQTAILKERQRIIQALVERVNIYADGRVDVLGVLDSTEAGQFELLRPEVNRRT